MESVFRRAKEQGFLASARWIQRGIVRYAIAEMGQQADSGLRLWALAHEIRQRISLGEREQSDWSQPVASTWAAGALDVGPSPRSGERTQADSVHAGAAWSAGAAGPQRPAALPSAIRTMLGDAAKEIAVYPGARFITAHSVPADRRMRIVLLFESHDAVSRVLDDYKSKIPDAGGHFETPSGSESGHLTYEDGTRTLEIVVAAEQGTNTIIAVTLV